MQAEGDVGKNDAGRVVPLERGAAPDFRTFFEDEHAKLFKTLYFVTADRQEAADLMQEAFLKLWERWDAVERIEDLPAYLFRVALNASRMRFRTARRAARRQVPLGLVRDEYEDIELREDVRRMLASISPRQRAALVLLDLYGYEIRKTLPGSWASGRPRSERSRHRVGPCSVKGARMPELKEVFDMVTKQTEPDLDSWTEQEERQRRSTRGRKLGVYALVAALIAGLVVLAVASQHQSRSGVATQPPTPSFRTTPPIGAQIVGADGTPVRQLPDLPAGAEGLRLSPDGKTVAFVIGGQVATIHTDGTDLTTLTSGTNANVGDAMNAVSWSPDGSQIAYAWNGDIHVMNADGSHDRTIVGAPSGDYYPAGPRRNDDRVLARSVERRGRGTP